MKPLVSILIPAYNAERTIAETISSAIAQTWARTEIIVVDDGSKDRTAEIAERFGSKITLVSRENEGAAAARNEALRISRGDFIQWLDADDILACNKIEQQLAALREGDSGRLLLSSPWASFYHRTRYARFINNSLCQDLSPVDWLIRKMGENLHMQTGTWLVSRELTETAGPWDTRLLSDDDGEYFCRVLSASEGTRFVRETGVFYRISPSNRLSHIGRCNNKKDAMLISMKIHIQHLRTMEESERVRKVCLTYLQNWFVHFYPERPDIVAEMQNLAAQLHGHLEKPCLRWKYAWIRPLFGWQAAKLAQMALPHLRASCVRLCDETMLRVDARRAGENLRGKGV
jgi:glycosyltransferase involved in cell wall biosynthesis